MVLSSLRVRSRRLKDESQGVTRGPTCSTCLGDSDEAFCDLDSALEVSWLLTTSYSFLTPAPERNSGATQASVQSFLLRPVGPMGPVMG